MIRLVTAALAAALLLPATASAFLLQERGGLRPGGTNGVVLGPDGNLWATEFESGTVVRMTPAGVALDRFTVGSNPTSMTVSPNGTVWVAVTGADKLVWIDALSATPTTHDVPIAGTDCGPVGLTAGNGRIYFTAPKEDDCSTTTSAVGAVGENGTGLVVQTNRPKARDIEFDNGSLWVPALTDPAVYKLNTDVVDAPFFDYTGDVPAPGTPAGVTVDNGTVWVTLFDGGQVGHFPSSATFSTSATLLTPPAGALAGPFGVVAGPGGQIYVAGSGSKNLARIDPVTKAFTFFSIGSGTPWQIVNGPDGDLWVTDTANPRLLRFVNGAPRATTGTAVAGSATSANLAAKVDPRGNATQVVFDYGPTTAYGSSSAAQTVPTGADPVDVQAALTGLAPSTTYHVRVRATNAEGETAGADATFTTPAAPVLTPTRLGAFARFAAKVRRTYTQLTKLRVEKLVGGETAKLTCKGGKKKGCPFASKTYGNLKPGTKALETSFGTKKRRLRPGVVVTLTVTKPGSVGRVVALTVRNRKAPRIVRRCLAPGATKPTAC